MTNTVPSKGTRVEKAQLFHKRTSEPTKKQVKHRSNSTAIPQCLECGQFSSHQLWPHASKNLRDGQNSIDLANVPVLKTANFK